MSSLHSDNYLLGTIGVVHVECVLRVPSCTRQAFTSPADLEFESRIILSTGLHGSEIVRGLLIVLCANAAVGSRVPVVRGDDAGERFRNRYHSRSRALDRAR